MQLPEPADSDALHGDTRRAIRMQPLRRKPSFRGEVVEVYRPRLKLRQHLFDRALDVVEIDGPWRVKRALVGQAAGCAKGNGGALVDSFGGAAENGAEFEEAHVADVAVKIAGDHGQHARNERGAQNAGLFAERVAERNDEAGLGRGERGLGSRAEGAGDGFVKAGGEQGAANRGFAFGPGQGADAFAECGEGVGEAVVTVDAGDLFDEVDFAVEIEAPTGQGDLPGWGAGSRFIARQVREPAAKRGEYGFDGCRR